MANPTNFKYTKDHEWAKVDGGVVVVGITDYAQHALGDVVYVDASAVGKKVEQHEPFGVVESVKAASDLFSPVTGEITAINGELADHPELVNTDPYGAGWMIQVKVSDLKQLDHLMSAGEYDEFLKTL